MTKSTEKDTCTTRKHWNTRKNDVYVYRELHNQGKQITLYKVPAHIELRGNEEVGKAAIQAIDMTGMTTTRLPHIDYYLIFKRARNFE